MHVTLFCGKLNAFAQLLDLFFGGLAADLHQILFRNVGGGVGKLGGHVAVVGEKEQDFAEVIEAADGIDARGNALDEIHHGGAAFGVGDGGDVALGLVKENVDVLLGL